MQNKLFTLEKGPFLAVALFSFSLASRYFEDLRKSLFRSQEYEHALLLFIFLLIVGTLSIGLYIAFIIAEKNIYKNLEKVKNQITDEPYSKKYILLDLEDVSKNPEKLEGLFDKIISNVPKVNKNSLNKAKNTGNS